MGSLSGNRDPSSRRCFRFRFRVSAFLALESVRRPPRRQRPRCRSPRRGARAQPKNDKKSERISCALRQTFQCTSDSGVWSLCVTDDNKLVAGCDGCIQIWNTQEDDIAQGLETTAICKDVYEVHAGAVRALTMTHDGKVITGSEDGKTKIWDI